MAEARFRAEALIASALRHPHIVQVFDMGELPDGRPYILMEYMEGEDLHNQLCLDGPMELDRALLICRQAGLALHEAHSHSIVHRDIKPSNMFLLRTPLDVRDRTHVKLIDFGTARMRGALADRFQTQDYQILGTPYYMSPEALLGIQTVVDDRSDQYSLALVLCQMLIGPPDDRVATSPESLIVSPGEMPWLFDKLPHSVPAPLRDAIAKALSWRKGDRFPSILDFVTAVSPAPAVSPPSAMRVTVRQTASAQSQPLILIVDDDPELRTLLSTLFEMDGFACCLLADASEGMEVVRQLSPQVVLLDVMLPGKSGYKFCWELKSREDTRHIPVLLLSGKAMEADRKLGLAMKADDYLREAFQLEGPDRAGPFAPESSGGAGRRRMTSLSAVRKTPLFRALSDEEAQTVLHAVLLMKIRRGETLCRHGDPGDSIFIVSSCLLSASGPSLSDAPAGWELGQSSTRCAAWNRGRAPQAVTVRALGIRFQEQVACSIIQQLRSVEERLDAILNRASPTGTESLHLNEPRCGSIREVRRLSRSRKRLFRHRKRLCLPPRGTRGNRSPIGFGDWWSDGKRTPSRPRSRFSRRGNLMRQLSYWGAADTRWARN